MPAQNSPQTKSTDSRKLTAEEAAAEEQKHLDLEKELNKTRGIVSQLRTMEKQLNGLQSERPSRAGESAIQNIQKLMLMYLLDEHDILDNL